MRYTQVPVDTFSTMQMNAGVITPEFDTSTGTLDKSKIIGPTSGGINFTATPTYSDFGDDIDNVPKNTKELKRLDGWDVTMTGTLAAVRPATAKILVGAADLQSGKITPHADLAATDFIDTLWFVGDYSDKNGATNGGIFAIKLINALSTGGFQLQTTDRQKGKFAFTFTAHFSIEAIDTVPFEIYVQAGTAEPA